MKIDYGFDPWPDWYWDDVEELDVPDFVKPVVYPIRRLRPTMMIEYQPVMVGGLAMVRCPECGWPFRVRPMQLQTVYGQRSDARHVSSGGHKLTA